MGKKRKELSHAEIWDDSGLIESWNQSYEEYKQYHSIHARGESVKDILAQAEAAQADEDKSRMLTEEPQRSTVADDVLEDGEVADTTLPTSMDNSHMAASQARSPAQEQKPPNSLPNGSTEPQHVPMAMTEAATQDQGLKNLMMSWYWAGYYTGFYEGQRSTEGGIPNETTTQSNS